MAKRSFQTNDAWSGQDISGGMFGDANGPAESHGPALAQRGWCTADSMAGYDQLFKTSALHSQTSLTIVSRPVMLTIGPYQLPARRHSRPSLIKDISIR